MSTDIEELIREVQILQAARAVPSERILAGLPARQTRAARQRRLILVGAAAGAVVVVTAPFVVFRREPVDRAPDGPGSVATPTLAADPAVPLRYRPAWLPPGLVERSRLASLDPVRESRFRGVNRIWKAGPIDVAHGDTAGPRLELTVLPTMADPGGEAVDIGGRPGFYNAGDASVRWRVDDATDLIVGAPELGLSRDDLLRVARSVRPDDARLRLPLRAGWLPRGIVLQHVQAVGNSPTDWRYEISGETYPPTRPQDSGDEPRSLSISVGTATNAPSGGQVITVRGRPARLVTGGGQCWVVAELGAGRLVTVLVIMDGPDPLTSGDAVRTAEGVEVDENPDVEWLGR